MTFSLGLRDAFGACTPSVTSDQRRKSPQRPPSLDDLHRAREAVATSRGAIRRQKPLRSGNSHVDDKRTSVPPVARSLFRVVHSFDSRLGSLNIRTRGALAWPPARTSP